LAAGGDLSGHLWGHQGGTCGDVLSNVRIWELPASLSEISMFLSVLLQEIQNFAAARNSAGHPVFLPSPVLKITRSQRLGLFN
jgi:hypothetical protein